VKFLSRRNGSGIGTAASGSVRRAAMCRPAETLRESIELRRCLVVLARELVAEARPRAADRPPPGGPSGSPAEGAPCRWRSCRSGASSRRNACRHAAWCRYVAQRSSGSEDPVRRTSCYGTQPGVCASMTWVRSMICMGCLFGHEKPRIIILFYLSIFSPNLLPRVCISNCI
jgi:hypothetical protein